MSPNEDYTAVRDAAIATSLANLCYLKVWCGCLAPGGYESYLAKLPASPVRIAAVFLNVLFLATLFWAGAQWVRSGRRARITALARLGFVAALIIPLNAVRMLVKSDGWLGRLSLYFRPDTPGGMLRLCILTIGGCCAFVLLAKPISRAASVALLILWPFVLVTFGSGIVQMFRYNPAPYRDLGPAARIVSSGGAPRIVWMIFDEMDQRLAFDKRERNLQLPEFDRFRAQALYAENALPPAGETLESIPSLTIGRVVERGLPRGPTELDLLPDADGKPLDWRAQPTVFTEARRLGFNAAVVGWYHPYCRLFGASLTDCWWSELMTSDGSTESSAGTFLMNQARSLVETATWSPWDTTVTTETQIRLYSAVLERAKRAAVDPGLGLVLLHLPAPHGPFLYDRTTGRFSLRNSPIRGYWDNLALADRTLGELRSAMERAGTWDRTTVLISADHSFRESQRLDGRSDPRVPFLLHLAGQNDATVFHTTFNTVVTHDLLLAILRREIRTTTDAASWIGGHASPAR